MKSHPEGFASLSAAVARSLSLPRPVPAFGCVPFTPDRDFVRTEVGGSLRRSRGLAVAKGPCPICGRPLNQAGPLVPDDGPDFLHCGGCERASYRLESVVAHQLQDDRQRKHRINHNRQLTAGTPTPAILLEADAGTAPAEGKKRKAAS